MGMVYEKIDSGTMLRFFSFVQLVALLLSGLAILLL